jgi:hypothetical protein
VASLDPSAEYAIVGAERERGDSSGEKGAMRRLGILGLAALALVAAFALHRHLRSRDGEVPELAGLDADARVRTACSGCHPFPPPEILPRSSWRGQIEHMAMVADYLPSAYVAPRVSISVDEAAAWYEARAPELLPVGPPQTRDAPAPLRFRRRFVLMGPESGPGVATVSRLAGRLETGAGPLLAAPNMATGSIHLFTLRGGPRRVGAASHPARVSAGDLDGDGLEDLLVADLGHPLPTDDRTGRVLLGRNRGGGRFELETILDDVGRVADAKPLDLDGDGDLDVVVAAFGWLRSGGIHVLHNETRAPGAPAFRSERVNQRSGAVSVVPTRELWPGAGAGFVVAFSQH